MISARDRAICAWHNATHPPGGSCIDASHLDWQCWPAPRSAPGEPFQRAVATELATWSEIVAKAGIKPQ
jgi:hypothetical protein